MVLEVALKQPTHIPQFAIPRMNPLLFTAEIALSGAKKELPLKEQPPNSLVKILVLVLSEKNGHVHCSDSRYFPVCLSGFGQITEQQRVRYPNPTSVDAQFGDSRFSL